MKVLKQNCNQEVEEDSRFGGKKRQQMMRHFLGEKNEEKVKNWRFLKIGATHLWEKGIKISKFSIKRRFWTSIEESGHCVTLLGDFEDPCALVSLE